MVEKAGGSAELAALMMIVDQMPKLVEEQVKAISNLKIDQVTVWENGGSGEGGQTANFLSSLDRRRCLRCTTSPRTSASSCPSSWARSTTPPSGPASRDRRRPVTQPAPATPDAPTDEWGNPA